MVKSKHVPVGWPTVIPRIAVDDSEALVAFLQHVFGAVGPLSLEAAIGDIHQPLHVSFADDRGGNFIREAGPCVNSLHTVWDTCIIEKKRGTDVQGSMSTRLWGRPTGQPDRVRPALIVPSGMESE